MKNVLRILGPLCLFVVAQIMAGGLMLLQPYLPSPWMPGWLANAVAADAEAWFLGASTLLASLLTIIGMAMFRLTDKQRMRLNGCGLSALGYTILLMLPAIFLINLLSDLFAWDDVNEELFEALMCNPLGIPAIVFTGPLAEEMVFRMGMQTALCRAGLSPWRAILTSALMFGLVHMNPAQIPGATLFGLILGWLYLRSGSIWLPVTAHMVNNLTGVLLYHLTGDAELTMTELCGGAGPASAIALLSLGWFLWTLRSMQAVLPATEPVAE